MALTAANRLVPAPNHQSFPAAELYPSFDPNASALPQSFVDLPGREIAPKTRRRLDDPFDKFVHVVYSAQLIPQPRVAKHDVPKLFKVCRKQVLSYPESSLAFSAKVMLSSGRTRAPLIRSVVNK
jgi:hypothetical protein